MWRHKILSLKPKAMVQITHQDGSVWEISLHLAASIRASVICDAQSTGGETPGTYNEELERGLANPDLIMEYLQSAQSWQDVKEYCVQVEPPDTPPRHLYSAAFQIKKREAA